MNEIVQLRIEPPVKVKHGYLWVVTMDKRINSAVYVKVNP